jgi:hypothetical protein
MYSSGPKTLSILSILTVSAVESDLSGFDPPLLHVSNLVLIDLYCNASAVTGESLTL